MPSSSTLAKSDWLRFQLKSDKRVLEGFIQEINRDGTQLRVGPAPDSPRSESFAQSDIILLKHQRNGAPA